MQSGIASLLILVISIFPVIAVGQDSSRENILELVQEQESSRQYIQALTTLEPIASRFPDDRAIQLLHGRLLVKNGLGHKAITRLQPLANAASEDWRPWFWLGSAYLIAEDLDSAGIYLDEALVREGQVASIWVQRAIIEQELGNSLSAANLLQVANTIEPQNPDIILNLAYASERSGDSSRAIEAYKLFLKLSASSLRYGRIRSQISQRLSLF